MATIAAVDLGTTSVRVGLYDEAGNVTVMLQEPLGIQHPAPGRVEQDPAELLNTTIEVLRAAITSDGHSATEVGAIGIANQRGTIVAWDASTGLPLGPAVGWQDTRSLDRVSELAAMGIAITTTASCSKLEWLVTHDETCRDARVRGTLRLGTLDSWLTLGLTGGEAWVTDPANAAATGLYEGHTRSWNPRALDLFGLSEDLLPRVVGSSEVVGATPSELFGSSIPVAGRCGDQQAACFAHGLEPGEAKLTLGTSAMLDLAVGSAPLPAPKGAYTLPLWRIDDAEPSCHEGSINAAGAVFEWLVRVGLLSSVAELDSLTIGGSPETLFLPALAGLGAPHHDGATRGLLTGIGLDTGADDIVGAAVLGIAQRVAELTQLLAVEGSLIVDGGLSRSRVVLGAVADATGCEVNAATDPETTLRGAAMFAAAAPGVSPTHMPPATTVEPIKPTTTSAEREENRKNFTALVEVARP